MLIRVLRYVAVVAVVCCVGVSRGADASGQSAPATGIPQDFELSNGSRIHIGGDLRMRWETIDPEVVNPDAGKAPAMQYLRVRTRVWGSLELPDAGATMYLRLANRAHYYSSNYTADPNNTGAATWRFPDETVLDNLYLKLKHDEFTAIVGRQDLVLGSGMWFAEGCPYVQARSFFHDGVTLRYDSEDGADHLVLFSFYDTWKDGSVFINDQNRRLRLGNIFTAGLFGSHRFTDLATLELYYMYNDVEDKGWGPVRGHRLNNNMSLHTAGFRVHGNLNEQFSYSVELARQFGYNDTHDDNQGVMADNRIRWKAPKETPFQPEIGLQYLYLSGDKDSTNRNEGWVPLMAEYPIFREELLAVTFNGNWTNLHVERAEFVIRPLKDLKLTFAPGLFQADTADKAGCTGGGHSVGTTLAAFLDYKLTDHISIAGEICRFKPGDFYGSGKSSLWSRTQILFTF